MVKRAASSIGPVRALALKHVPALMLLMRHVDVEWGDEVECAAEQLVAGYWFPKEIDYYEKEETAENENPQFKRDLEFHVSGTESRRRGAEEDEGEVDVYGPDLSPL